MVTRDSRPAVVKLAGCLAWLAIYAALTWALAIVVLRRLEIPQLAFAGSALIALMVCVAVAHLIHVLRVAIDLLLRFTRHESGVFFDGTKPHTAPSAASSAGSEPLMVKLRRGGSGLMNGVVYTALAAGMAALLFAFAPLEHQAPSWEEIRIESLLDQKVRPRIVQAEILPIPPPARTLKPGEARGRFRVGGREWRVDRASSARNGSGEEIALYSGDELMAIISIDARGMASMRTAAGPLRAPDVMVDIRQAANGWIGRITWSEGQLVFRV